MATTSHHDNMSTPCTIEEPLLDENINKDDNSTKKAALNLDDGDQSDSEEYNEEEDYLAYLNNHDNEDKDDDGDDINESQLTAVDPKAAAIFTKIYANKDKEGYWDYFTNEELMFIASINNVPAWTAMKHLWIASDPNKHLVWHISKTYSLRKFARRKIEKQMLADVIVDIIAMIKCGMWSTLTEEHLKILADRKMFWCEDLNALNINDKEFWVVEKCRIIQQWAFDTINYPNAVENHNKFETASELYNLNQKTKTMIPTDVTFQFTIYSGFGKKYQQMIFTNLHGKITHFQKSAPVNWKDEVKVAILNKFGKKNRNGQFEANYTVKISNINVKTINDTLSGYESDEGVDNVHFDFYGKDDSYKQLHAVKKPEKPSEKPAIYN